MKKTRDEVRHHNQRLIARRLGIRRHVWCIPDDTWAQERAGSYRKFNLACSCGMCRKPRYVRATADWAE